MYDNERSVAQEPSGASFKGRVYENTGEARSFSHARPLQCVPFKLAHKTNKH